MSAAIDKEEYKEIFREAKENSRLRLKEKKDIDIPLLTKWFRESEAKAITSVNLSLCDMKAEDTLEVIRSFSYLEKLEDIYLTGNVLNEEACTCLSHLLLVGKVKILVLVNTQLSRAGRGLGKLVESLNSEKNGLAFLDLTANDLTDDAASLLATLSHCKLQKLFLASNRITDEGARSLMAILPPANKSLKKIDLSDNRIGVTCCEELAATAAMRIEINLSKQALIVERITSSPKAESKAPIPVAPVLSRLDSAERAQDRKEEFKSKATVSPKAESPILHPQVVWKRDFKKPAHAHIKQFIARLSKLLEDSLHNDRAVYEGKAGRRADNLDRAIEVGAAATDVKASGVTSLAVNVVRVGVAGTRNLCFDMYCGRTAEFGAGAIGRFSETAAKEVAKRYAWQINQLANDSFDGVDGFAYYLHDKAMTAVHKSDVEKGIQKFWKWVTSEETPSLLPEDKLYFAMIADVGENQTLRKAEGSRRDAHWNAKELILETGYILKEKHEGTTYKVYYKTATSKHEKYGFRYCNDPREIKQIKSTLIEYARFKHAGTATALDDEEVTTPREIQEKKKTGFVPGGPSVASSSMPLSAVAKAAPAAELDTPLLRKGSKPVFWSDPPSAEDDTLPSSNKSRNCCVIL